MNKELIIKRKKLLKRISKRQYVDLLRYIGKVYLADYDLKILMARKFSNLFHALLPLALYENGGRLEHLYDKKFQDESKRPKIISNRALSLLKEAIQNGQYKKILLADDIIIHGRTMEQIYLLLKSWFEEAGITDYVITVYAYAESLDGLVKEKEFLNVREVEHKCLTSQWREISNLIVDIFYLFETPYTSYVPNACIDKDSDLGQQIEKWLHDEQSGVVNQTSHDMERYSVKSFAYISKEESPAFLNNSIRIYEYKELQQYVLVPMVMLNPVAKDILTKYIDVLSDVMVEKAKNSLLQTIEDDVAYRAVIYVISALWGWKFINTHFSCPYSSLKYAVEEERINFGTELLQENLSTILTAESVEKLLNDISSKYQEVENIDEIIKMEEDFEILDNKLNDIINEISETCTSSFGAARKYARELIGKYLSVNGELDEQLYKEESQEDNQEDNQEDKRRLIGYPVVKLVEKLKQYKEELIPAILYAIDFGKGSIVSRIVEYNSKKYYFSVIHAGEQNYKYYENVYFPFLYGLYHIEYMAEILEEKKHISTWKESFVKELLIYWKNVGNYYLDDDINNLKAMCITNEFKDVILNDAWGYFEQPDFKYAVDLAKKIAVIEDDNGRAL